MTVHLAFEFWNVTIITTLLTMLPNVDQKHNNNSPLFHYTYYTTEVFLLEISEYEIHYQPINMWKCCLLIKAIMFVLYKQRFRRGFVSHTWANKWWDLHCLRIWWNLNTLEFWASFQSTCSEIISPHFWEIHSSYMLEFNIRLHLWSLYLYLLCVELIRASLRKLTKNSSSSVTISL